MIITFVGDISLDSIDLDIFSIDDEIQSILKSSDITIGNLENPVTAGKDKQSLLPINLRSDVNSIRVLKYFTAVNLANNHIFDFGIEGFNDTTRFLYNNNILYWGAGVNIKEANSPLKIERQDSLKIAFISGTRWANSSLKKPGTANFRGHSESINDLKSRGFFVVYYPHWGYEYILIPPPDVRRHARKMIDYGVDLIVGTHPHILQGFEIYKGKYIFYSLGNFIFCQKHFESLASIEDFNMVNTSIILKLHLLSNGIKELILYPFSLSDNKIRLIHGDNKEKVLNDLKKNSEIFNLSKTTYLKKYYSQVPDIVEHNKKVRIEFQNFREKDLFKKFSLLRNVTKQDFINRLVSFIKST